MKTQIIRLETHDDAISVKDKMGWGQTPRILLVWPAHSRMLNRRLDLVYLKRHSTAIGAQLAIVSNDPNVRYHAGFLSIPIYANIKKAEASHWRRSRRLRKGKTLGQIPSIAVTQKHPGTIEKTKLNEMRLLAHPAPARWLLHPITRLILFTSGVIGVLAIAAILLPSADIELTPKTERQELTIPASASTDFNAVDLSGLLPAYPLSVVVEGRGSLPTSSSIAIPDQKAQGKVVFTNLTDQLLTIPSGTVVSTTDDSPTRFVTLQVAEVSPENSSDLVSVEAIHPGREGNVLSNHIIAIEGQLGLSMTVTNPIGTSKGTDRISRAPDEKDYRLILDKMLQELHETSVQELAAKLNPQDLILAVDPTQYTVLEASYTPAEIQPADQLHLTLRVEYQALIVSEDDLSVLSQSVLDTNTPDGFAPIQSTLEIKTVSTPVLNTDDIFEWDMVIKWQAESYFDQIDAVTLALWKTPQDATQELQTYLPVENNVQIKLTPYWWPRLPILPFRVTVSNTPMEESFLQN